MKGLSKAKGLLWPNEAVRTVIQLKVKRGGLRKDKQEILLL